MTSALSLLAALAGAALQLLQQRQLLNNVMRVSTTPQQ